MSKAPEVSIYYVQTKLGITVPIGWCEDQWLYDQLSSQLKCTTSEVREALRAVLPLRVGLRPGTNMHYPNKRWTCIKEKHVPAVEKALEHLAAKAVVKIIVGEKK